MTTNEWPTKLLSDAFFFQEGPGVRKWQFTTSGIKLLNVANIEKSGYLNLGKTERHLSEDEVKRRYSHFLVDEGDLVIASSGISFDSDGFLRTRGAFVYAEHLPLCLNTSTIRFKAIDGVSDLAFLRHWIDSLDFRRQITQRVTGSAQQNFGPSHLKELKIPLPPLSEQKRIAEILDRAEALRAKRRAALALLDELTQSIFLDMFGDPVTNPKGWPTVSLLDVISMPLRNGLSPSKSGKVLAKVLTLSAITGSGFDPFAVKESTFMNTPPMGQSVHETDFLICRGNGNLDLVGRGFFPKASMPNTTFPDTMIAARIQSGIQRPFLELVWNSRAVRAQIEASARTTNGTYKVNQTMLEAVVFICPPMDLQSTFTNRIVAIENLKSSQETSLSEFDQLFASLQHQAFRGEL